MRSSLYVILFLVSSVSFSQVTRQADITQEIGYSAKQVGLGKSSISRASNVFDMTINPALLSNQVRNSIGYTHNNHFGGIVRLDNIAFQTSLDESPYSFGASFFRLQNNRAFDSRNLVSTDGSINYDELKINKSNDFGLKLLLARSLDSAKVDIGVEFGVDLVSVADFSQAFSLGFDLGIVKKIDSTFNVSLVVENVVGRYYFWNQSVTQLEDVFFATDNYLRTNTTVVQLPYLRAGVNKYLINQSNYYIDGSVALGVGYGRSANSLLAASSFNLSPSLALEGSYKETLFVRLGMSSFQKVESQGLKVSPSVGFGINYLDFKIDYALTNFIASAIPLQQHVISLNYSFDAKNKVHDISDNPSRF